MSSIQEVIECVENSTPITKVNQAIAVGNEQGEVKINVYDWLNFFKVNGAKKVQHITSYNHFEFCETKKGKVTCKLDIDRNEFVHRIFIDESGPTGFPNVIIPEGMSHQRKEYLYRNIRNFCKEEWKDILCPEVEQAAGTHQDELSDHEQVTVPLKKREKGVFKRHSGRKSSLVFVSF